LRPDGVGPRSRGRGAIDQCKARAPSATRYFFGSVPPSPPSLSHLRIFAIRALAMPPLYAFCTAPTESHWKGAFHGHRIRRREMTSEDDTALIAGQLADLTHAVEQMSNQLKALGDRADSQQVRADTQQERIDLAARELAEVSERLQAAANALRESV
jgi:hypothetical protein